LIEFRYADGAVVSGDYAWFSSRTMTKGDRLDYDGQCWLMYDREDRAGVTVYLFSPGVGESHSRARIRQRGPAGYRPA
jgi:hypothetical protein